MRETSPRGPKKELHGGRCFACGEIFINQPLYLYRGGDFACKACTLRLQKEGAEKKEQPTEEWDDAAAGHILEVNEEDL